MIYITQKKINSVRRETEYIWHSTQCIYKIHTNKPIKRFSINEISIETIKMVIPKKNSILFCEYFLGKEKNIFLQQEIEVEIEY